ncbi:unnamed protein product [Spirodela intermedia]|uniref:Uncharacterized protein n=1 Tax=Spirodela intermedia TaxID=51605 RepID=A0A7I8K5U2_SPIIN|nr:unnamed protein product [Spirodela intermedia]
MADAGSCRTSSDASGALARESGRWWMGRVEIDTSAPFESVKEAVTRFGGSAPWRPPLQLRQQLPSVVGVSDADFLVIKEQTANLEKDLIVKERETLDVLKELEATKMIVDGLKTKIKEEASEISKISEKNPDSTRIHPIVETELKAASRTENCLNQIKESRRSKPSPGLILMELKQAKVNLTRATSDLVDIRASVESLYSQIENERTMLDETRERISSNSSKISDLEKELHQTRLMIQFTKNDGNGGCMYPPDISQELHKLNSEVEQYRRMAEAGESEVLKMRAEIERTKASIKTAEIRFLAAKKMEEAAKAAEASTLAEIKALTDSDNPPEVLEKKSSMITLTTEEYESLGKKAQQADELSTERIKSAMAEVEEANRSKQELLQKVEEATLELKTSRKALMEALSRVESANQGKLAVEEALRRWRSEHHSQRRRPSHSTTRFKNPGPVHHHHHQRRDSKMLDVNGCSLVADGSKPVLRPTLSIGQILSRKLYGSGDLEAATQVALQAQPKVSLGQMLSRRQGSPSPPLSEDKATARRRMIPSKRKKFGFAGLSHLLANQNKKKMKAKKKRKKKLQQPS